MKKGTHNTMTYLKPRKWWMYLFVPFSKCQRVDLKKQAEFGARYFDFRVRYVNGELVFAHGLVEYKADVFFTLRQLRDMNISPVVRIGYEGDLKEDSEANDHFSTFVQWAKDRFKVHLVFSKKNYKVLYKDDSIRCVDLYEMYLGNRIPFPIKYAKKKNSLYHQAIEVEGGRDYAMLDFIDIK